MSNSQNHRKAMSDTTSETARHRRKRGKGRKKPFAIERRFSTEGLDSWLYKWFHSDNPENQWRVYKTYETERDRNNALDALVRRKTVLSKYYEYRILDNTLTN